jgi:diguanylate cyclase (GGDEF)-like protein/PAS domain S-box-containing protein
MIQAGHILAIDDNATARKTLELRLQSKGYQIDSAASGPEGLRMLAERDYDVVLLDRKMPDMSGTEVLQRLREAYSMSELPVIMLTVSEECEAIVEALQIGANDYIVKPGVLEVIDARIRAQLSVKRLNDLGQAQQRGLERRVNGRTRQLHHSNELLREEIRYRATVEQELRASEQRYRCLYDNNPSMFFTTDAQGWIISVNRFGAKQLGYKRGDLVGSSIIDTYHSDDREMARSNFAALQEQPERLHRWELRKVHKKGNCVWVRETARVVQDGETSSVLLVCEDISETQLLSEKLNFEANRDRITGLTNRRRFERVLKDLMTNVWHDKTTHALCYLDLDQFKVVNDTCGHSAGDMLLKQVAQVLRGSVRRQDLVARLGGDEFGVLFRHCTRSEALDLSRRLLDALQSSDFDCSRSRFAVGASMGLVMIDEGNCDVENILSLADSACFQAKDSGRNRVHVYSSDDAEFERRAGEMAWVSRITEALDDDRLVLAVQPIVPVQQAHVNHRHVELLLRMRDKDGRLIVPGEFLPAAERYNLIGKLDRWVVEHAFAWLRQGSPALGDLEVCSINLSGQSLGDDLLLQRIISEFNRGGLAPETICFEVTETATIANLNAARHFITTLKEHGCAFALDDFGSGLSSFAYLKDLPVDYLKIDGLFVRDIDTSTIDLAMVRSINEIGHVMGKKTIAEFVENDTILERLKELGVDYAQGYGIGRPQPIEEFEPRPVGDMLEA